MTRIPRKKGINGLRQAFVTSVLSLLICVSMLIGSTYAWLSDGASTAPQIITAGNLQIDLLKYEGGKYISADDSPVFDNDFLWEPGAAQIVFLAVENKGSLACKFNVLLTVSDGGLAETLEYVVLSDKEYFDAAESEGWEGLLTYAEADEAKQAIGSKRIFGLKENGTLETTEIYYFVLAIHMREGSENSYMDKWVDFNIAVNAVQTPKGNDSVGSGYDAELPLHEPHGYLMHKNSGDGRETVVSNVDDWNGVVKEILPDGVKNTDIKKVVFGRWNEQRRNLPERNFADGVPIGVILKSQKMQDGDVRGFYTGDGALYILVNDSMGTIVVTGSMGNSSNGYFMGWTALEEVDLSCLNTADMKSDFENYHRVTAMGNLFNGCTMLRKIKFGSGFDTSNVNEMRNMFKDCASLEALDLSSFNTANVTRMDNMFQGCAALKTLDLTSFNTENVTNMSNLFDGCASLETISLTPIAFQTGKLSSMANMFRDCAALTNVNVSGFDTASVTTMKNMFSGCESLLSIDLSGFDTGKVTAMNQMFRDCKSLRSVVFGDNFTVSSVNTFQEMFHTCSSLTILDLSGFDVKESANCEGMFRNCSALETIYASSNFNLNNKENADINMFLGCKSLNKGSTDALAMRYDEAKVDSTYAMVGIRIIGMSFPGYFVSKPAA